MAIKSAIVMKFTMASVAKELNTTQDRIIEASLNVLNRVGEESITQARDHGSYKDVTGNLRSSIGYVTLKAGSVVTQAKPKAYKGPKGDGSQGVKESEKLLRKLRGQYPQGLALIVTAGMEYAEYVEGIHHKDVLTSAQLLAEKNVPDYFDRIGLKKKKA